MASIRDMFDSRDPDHIAAARELLNRLPDEDARTEFRVLTQDPNPEIRAQAITVNVNYYSPVIKEFARTLLRDPVSFVRWHACVALHFCHCSQAADEIAHLLVSDPSATVRSKAAAALGALGHPDLLGQLARAAVSENATDHEGTPIQETIQAAIDQIRSRYHLAAPGEEAI